MVNVEDLHRSGGFVDAVDDPVGAASSAVAAGEWSEQRLADSLWVGRERLLAEFQYGRGNGLGQAVGDRPPCGGLEPHVVRRVLGHPLSGAGHPSADQVGSHRSQVDALFAALQCGEAF